MTSDVRICVFLPGRPSKHAKVSVWRTENRRQPNSKRGKLVSPSFIIHWIVQWIQDLLLSIYKKKSFQCSWICKIETNMILHINFLEESWEFVLLFIITYSISGKHTEYSELHNEYVSSLLFVHVSLGWRTRTSSRCIKNRPADIGMIKRPAFLTLFFFLFFFFFCILFCMYVRIFVQFQTIWINRLYQGFHVWGQEGEQTEVRTKKRTRWACRWFSGVQGCSCCWPVQ